MSLKDRLASRQRPSTTYQLRIDNDDVARSELAAARAAGDESRIVAAQQAVEACYEQVPIVAIRPGPGPNPRPDQEIDMETLLKAHPPTPEQRERGSTLFNPETFVPALLELSVKCDPVITAAEWAEYTTSGAMTIGEVTELFNRVWELNYRTPDPAVPKD